MLVQAFPITGNRLVANPFPDLWREVIAGGRDQPAACIGFQDQPGQAIAAAIDEAHGVGPGIQQGRAFRDGVLKEAKHEGADSKRDPRRRLGC